VRAVVRSSQFKRDVKRAGKRGKNLSKLRELLDMLIEGKTPPPRYHDHALKGDWHGYRDAHIEADWLLIYRVTQNELHLARTGRHPDIFDE
jgi:mRNA interferase YafQ